MECCPLGETKHIFGTTADNRLLPFTRGGQEGDGFRIMRAMATIEKLKASPTMKKRPADRRFSACVMWSFVVVLAACGGGAPGDDIDPGNPAQVAQGALLYRVHCAACHGTELEGQANWRTRLPNGRLPAPPHDETGHTWHHSNAQLFAMTRNGLVPPLAPEGYESDMPAYANVLSDDEIRAVLAYIQSTWSAEVWEIRRKMLTQGRP